MSRSPQYLACLQQIQGSLGFTFPEEDLDKVILETMPAHIRDDPRVPDLAPRMFNIGNASDPLQQRMLAVTTVHQVGRSVDPQVVAFRERVGQAIHDTDRLIVLCEMLVDHGALCGDGIDEDLLADLALAVEEDPVL